MRTVEPSEEIVRGYRMLGQVLNHFTVATVLPFDENAAVLYANLITRRLRVATMDLRIASIALSRDMTLVSRNARDFRDVPGLRIEDWTT